MIQELELCECRVVHNHQRDHGLLYTIATTDTRNYIANDCKHRCHDGDDDEDARVCVPVAEMCERPARTRRASAGRLCIDSDARSCSIE